MRVLANDECESSSTFSHNADTKGHKMMPRANKELQLFLPKSKFKGRFKVLLLLLGSSVLLAGVGGPTCHVTQKNKVFHRVASFLRPK